MRSCHSAVDQTAEAAAVGQQITRRDQNIYLSRREKKIGFLAVPNIMLRIIYMCLKQSCQPTFVHLQVKLVPEEKIGFQQLITLF